MRFGIAPPHARAAPPYPEGRNAWRQPPRPSYPTPYAVSRNNSRPINIRRISLVPAPIS